MGPVLSKALMSKVIDRDASPTLVAGICSINGWRNSMEDAHAFTHSKSNGKTFLGVFDGHAGDKCSAYVADHLPEKALALDPASDANLEQLLLDVDKDFLATNLDGGSTGTMIIIDPPAAATDNELNATVCNVGDSRVIVMRKAGGKWNEAFATVDHKPNNAGEKARIEATGGFVRGDRVDGDLAVSRAFGDAGFKAQDVDPRNTRVTALPEISHIQVQRGDVLIVACDGVFERNFSTQEVIAFVGDMIDAPGDAQDDFGTMASLVCHEAVKRGSKDNITCAIAAIPTVEQAQKNIGETYLAKYGKLSFVPGAPDFQTNNPYRTQWQRMCEMASTTPAQALKRRGELWKLHRARAQAQGDEAKLKEIDAQLPPCDRVVFLDMDAENQNMEAAYWDDAGAEPTDEWYATKAEAKKKEDQGV